MDFTFMFWAYVIVNLILSGLVSYVASEKGRGAAAFFLLSFFFSFLVGILVALALPNKGKVKAGNSSDGSPLYGLDENFDCPACAEQIKLAAKICKYCGTSVEQVAKEIVSAARATYERSVKLQEEATQSALADLKEQRAARRSKFEALLRSRLLKIFLIILTLLGLGALVWGLLSPAIPTESQTKTNTAPESSSVLTSDWLRALESCQYLPTYGEADSERIYELDSGKVVWAIFQTSDSVSLDIDIWNSDRDKIECVSKAIFGTKLESVREGSPRQFSNGYSQGVEASTEFEGEGKASGYYFRWSR